MVALLKLGLLPENTYMCMTHVDDDDAARLSFISILPLFQYKSRSILIAPRFATRHNGQRSIINQPQEAKPSTDALASLDTSPPIIIIYFRVLFEWQHSFFHSFSWLIYSSDQHPSISYPLSERLTLHNHHLHSPPLCLAKLLWPICRRPSGSSKEVMCQI